MYTVYSVDINQIKSKQFNFLIQMLTNKKQNCHPWACMQYKIIKDMIDAGVNVFE
jgi:hypothetical protein